MTMRAALLLTFAFLFIASSAKAEKQCDGCAVYERTKARSKTPFNGARVCLDYVQAQRDKVVVRFMRGGSEIHTVSNETGPRDRFCFGKWRFTRSDVVPDEIWFCNGSKSARIISAQITMLGGQNGTSKGEYVCLLGSKECDGKSLARE